MSEIDPLEQDGPSSPGRARASSDEFEVIDFALYLPTVLSKLVGKLRQSANGFFGARYGLTLLEWRILSFVAAEGPSSAYAIWTEGGLDKAAVSRALKEMQRRGLVAVGSVPGSKRRKSIVSLTSPGQRLYDETFAEVLRRHERLLGRLPAAEVRALIATLDGMVERIPGMVDGPVGLTDFRPTKLKRQG